MKLTRITVPNMDALLGEQFPVLDQGFIIPVDYLGGDASIVRAARVSYLGGEGKTAIDDMRLIRRLMRDRHCYDADMEVLTTCGWKKWRNCSNIESFIIPNPNGRILSVESLEVKNFKYVGPMFSFDNSRMSFCVTPEHRMWFKTKYSPSFSIFHIEDMPRWGHFDPMIGYKIIGDDAPDLMCKLFGFYLGDGNLSSKNTISFHLKKERKIAYIKSILSDLMIDYNERDCGDGTTVISFVYPDEFLEFFSQDAIVRDTNGTIVKVNRDCVRSLFMAEKRFAMDLSYLDLTRSRALGIYDGLVNSDGHFHSRDKNRIDFANKNPDIIRIYEVVSALCGSDAHGSDYYHGVRMVRTYETGSRTTLESRKKFFSMKEYDGRVYCATSSTGLLIVRGGADKFGFVCGNTSPLEMCEIVYHVRLPIFVARQWVRHRTASLNEQSGRYTVLDEAFYTPAALRVTHQSRANKQGSGQQVEGDIAHSYLDLHAQTCHDAFKAYQWCLQEDIARELSRIDLPLSTYTQWYWKIDLHNLFHFLKLRMAPDAQWEIREYANVIASVVQQWVPFAYSGFRDYVLNARTFSSMELALLADVLNKKPIGTPYYYGMTDAEYGAFKKWLPPHLQVLFP